MDVPVPSWRDAYRSWANPAATTVEPAPEPAVTDPNFPTFEVWLDGALFASTQIPARAKAMLDGMTTGAAKTRYGYRTVELRVRNDRREAARD